MKLDITVILFVWYLEMYTLLRNFLNESNLIQFENKTR